MFNFSQFMCRCVAVFLCLFLLCLHRNAYADASSATLYISISDPSGAVVTGAHLLVRNTATGQEQQSESNKAGTSAFTFLRPGHYQLTVSKASFADVVVDNIALNVGDERRLQLVLKVGTEEQNVSVDASGLTLNTTDASVSTIVDRKFVENMPLNGRSVQDLLTLAPGVAQVPTNTGGGNTVGFSGEIVVNGQRAEANYYSVDGVSANSGASTQFGTGGAISGSLPTVSALGSTQSMISLDALQEFRSNTSTYSAEYGRTPGGNFSFSTRSGTNTFHGTLFDYLRNDALDANNWFNNYYGYPKGKERQNDFGGTFSGPVILPHLYNGKNKTFYFVSYEGLRLRTPQAATQVLVPTDATRQSAPAALRPLLNAFPVANYGVGTRSDGFAYYIQAVSYPSSLNSTSVRMDHNFGQKSNVFGRYAYTPSDTTTYTAAVKNATNFSARSLTLGANYAINSRQANELRFNWSKNLGNIFQTSTTLGGATPLDLGTLPGPGASSFPKMGSQLFASFSYASFTSLTLLQRPSNQQQFNLTDSHSWTVGPHTFKAGVDWRTILTTLTPLNPVEQVVFSNATQVLNNKPGTATVKGEAPQQVEPQYTNFSAYLQDEWRVSQRLSASLGVRWDLNPAPTDRRGPGPYTVNQVTDLRTVALAPTGTSLWKTDWTGFAPRIGVAYQLRPGSTSNTVLRAGFGSFYDLGNTQASLGYAGIGYVSTQRFPTASFPLTSAQLTLPSPSIAGPYSSMVVGFDPNLRLPYSFQYNAALEQQLGPKSSFTLGYVASGGRKLLTTFYTYPGTIGNSNFASSTALQLIQGRASSGYNSLQAKYQTTLIHGFQALASYTWSHAIDNASANFLIYQLLRADADFDIRHNAQAAITWQAPHRSATFWQTVASDWGTDFRFQARSGLPINIGGAQQILADTGTYTQFQPNYVSGVPVYLYGDYPGGRIINFSAFTAAPTDGQGNVPRNSARGFNAVQLDMSVRRTIPIHDTVQMQIRVESFNVTNHPVFGSIYSSLSNGASLFGRAYSTLNNSMGGGLNSLYQSGGPRSLQLMLKISF